MALIFLDGQSCTTLPERVVARRKNMKRLQRTMRSEEIVTASATWKLPVLLAVCVSVFLSVGCSTPGEPDSAHFASVEVHDQPVERVSDVTAEVFLKHGYKVRRQAWGRFFFEKQGSAMNNLAYGNWMGGAVWVRVKASVQELSPGHCQVKCEAFLLRNRGEPLEEEIRVRKVHSGHYQELLDEVAKRLTGDVAKPN